MIYDLFQAIINDINNIMNDINDIVNNIMKDTVNNKKGHNIVNDINDKKGVLLKSQTGYMLSKL